MGNKCKRAISLFTSLATILWLTGVAFLPMGVNAATVNEGDLITGPDGIAVYIVNAFGFKRHIFNPAVFNMYGHLKWSNIKSVDQATLDTYKNSDLYRVAGDPKVFSVTSDGQKRHLNMTADQFVASGYSWDQIFIVNEKEGNYYTTGADLTYTGATVTPTPSTGALAVSLASDNPAAAIIPAGVTGAEFLKFNVSGITTLNEVILKRAGIGLAADFSAVYLYDGATRLTTGKTVSSDTNTVTFVNLGLAVGSGKVLTAKVDLAAWATVTGRQDRVEVYSVNGTTVTGVAGNLMSYANVAVGTATIAETSATWNVTLGASNAEVAKFSIQETLGTAGDLSLRALTIRNAGSLSNSYLKNLVLKTSTGTTLGTVATMNGDKAIIALTTPYTVPKSQTKNFVLYGDITGGRANDTIKFYLDQVADLDLIDSTYGYGATLTNSWASGDQTVTAAGGEITLGFNGPAATTYAKDTTGQDLLKFSLTAEKNVSIEKTLIGIGVYDSTGTIRATGAGGYAYVKNVRIVDLATGNTLVGPITDSSATYLSSGYSATYGNYKESTDKFDLTAGTTKQLAIRADINTLFTATDAIKAFVSLAGIAGATTNYIYDTDASEYVAIAKIVPTSQLGNTMTVNAASLTLTKASTPVSASYVKGATGIEGLGVILTAGTADAVKLTKLVVRAYADTLTTFDTVGYGDTAANTLISTASLYDDAGTLIKGPVNASLVGTIGSSGYYKFDFTSLGYSIAAGAQKKFVVKVNATNTISGTKYLAIDVLPTDSEGEDSKGTSLSFATQTTNLNLATSPSPLITLVQAGTLTVSVDAGTPAEAMVVGGTTGVEFTKYKFNAYNESMKVTGLKLFNQYSATAGDYDNNLGTVTVSYPSDAAGTLVEKTGNFVDGNLTFSDGQVGIYVPKNSSAVLTIKANVNYTTTGAASGEKPRIGLYQTGDSSTNWDVSRNLTDAFIAQGVDSGTTVYGATNTIAVNNVSVKQMTVRASKPTLASGTLPSTKLNSGTNTLYKWTTSADSIADIGWDYIAFNVSGNIGNGTAYLKIGSDDATTPIAGDGIYVMNAGDGVVDSQVIAESTIKVYNSGTGVEVAGALFFRTDTNSTSGGYTVVFVPTTEETVAKGTTKTYELRGDVSATPVGASTSSGSISVKIADLATTVVTDTYANVASTDDADSLTTSTTTTASFIWTDGSDVSTSVDYADDWKVPGIPTTTLTMN